MPQVAAAVATFFGTATAAALGGGFTALGIGSFVGSALYYATNTFLLNKALGLISHRGKTGETRGMEVSFADATAPACILVGEVRVGGVNIVPSWTSGNEGRYQHQVIAYAAHEIDSFQAHYFDQTTLSSPGSITGTANDGLISSGDFANAAWVRGYRGTMTQNVDYILNTAFPTHWPTTSRGRGWAYIAYQYDWGKGKVYKSLPQPTAKIRGLKMYDPRLDSTNGGSGSQRYNDSTTWTWSQNNALFWAMHRMSTWGYNLNPATDINWPSVIAAADICDAAVANKDGGTSPRYTVNGRIEITPDGLNDVDQMIVDSMMGRRTFVNGQWHIYAGAWTSPTHTINRGDWLSIETINVVSGRDAGRHNEVHCYYVDPTRNWQRVECRPRRNTTYMSNDAGERISVEMEQPLCTDESEAQRKAEFLLRASRNGVRVVGTLPPRFRDIKTYNTVSMNFDELNFVSKTFRVVACTLNPDGSIKVALAEEQDTDWDDLAAGDYNAISTTAAPTTNPSKPTAAQNLTIAPHSGSLYFDWEDPIVVPRATRYRVLASPNSANAAVGSVIWDGDATFASVPWWDVTSRWWFYVQAYVGSYSADYTPSTFGVLAMPSLPANISRYPVADPYFSAGYTVGSYWDASAINSAYFRQPFEGYGLTADSGVYEINETTTGPSRATISPTRAAIPGATGTGTRFRLTPRQMINIFASAREMQDYGAGGGAQYKLYLTLLGPSVSTNYLNGLNVDVAGSGTWIHHVFSAQLPSALQYGEGFVQLVANINSVGRYQIGRFDVTLT